MILYDREDFYKLADVERVLGYKVCTDRRHYLTAPECWYEFDCECRNFDTYLIQVDGEDFILKTYAEQLITDKIKQDINVMHTYRFYDGKELRRRTPLYVHGTPMHPSNKSSKLSTETQEITQVEMLEKDVNLFVMLKKIMRTPIITAVRDDVSCEVTQLYNKQILAWSSYGAIYDNIRDAGCDATSYEIRNMN